MLCSISGMPPIEPVVTTQGVLYERRLIEKAIRESEMAESGGFTCVVTGEKITEDMLLPIKTAKVVGSVAAKSNGNGTLPLPRTTEAMNVPGLINMLQNEWDATMLETSKLKQELHTTRQELSHALYQHDAACRVIARLIKERDEAQAALSSATRANSRKTSDADLPEPVAKRTKLSDEDVAAKASSTSEFPAEIAAAMTSTASVLVKGRKKRAMSENLASVDDIRNITTDKAWCLTLHRSTKKGIFSLSVSDTTMVAGERDTKVLVKDRMASEDGVQKLTGHTKAITAISLGKESNTIISGSEDRTVRVWKADDSGTYSCTETFADQMGNVTSISSHPAAGFFLTSASDGTWSFYDINSSSCVAQVKEASGSSLTAASLHPDGLLYGTGGSDSVVRIWDIRSKKDVVTFQEHEGPVKGLSFSENGYLLASIADEGAKIWDLRKMKSVKDIEFREPKCTIAFDYSGLYLALVGRGSFRVVAPKRDYENLLEEGFDSSVSEVAGGISSFAWDVDAKGFFIAGSGDDRVHCWKFPSSK